MSSFTPVINKENIMKRLYGCLLILLSLTLGINRVNAAEEISVWIDQDYFPYTFNKGNGPEGVYINIIEEAFKNIDKYTLKWVSGSWKDGVTALQKGDVMGLVPPYYRPEKRPWMKPYSVPILDEVVSIVCNKEGIKGKNLKKFPDDYKGLSFSNNTGFASGGPEFTALVKAGEIKVIEDPDTETNLQLMLDGKVDCYINDRLAIAMRIKSMRGGISKIRMPGRVKTEQGYMGFSEATGKYPHTQEFLAQFNKIIDGMRESGRIKQIIDEFKKNK